MNEIWILVIISCFNQFIYKYKFIITTLRVDFPRFGKYLNKTGRPIIYSCCWPFYQERKGLKVNSKIIKGNHSLYYVITQLFIYQVNYKLVSKSCNLWRNYEDIQESYNSLFNVLDNFIAKQEIWTKYAGPGHWNDPDMVSYILIILIYSGTFISQKLREIFLTYQNFELLRD